jgi:KUP system potassium uptake protein
VRNIKKGIAGLTVGALGVVFGDIGTSPLYALSAVFGKISHRLAITQADIFGIISLIIWSVTLVVSIKFIGFIMRADNEGEGGIVALVAQIRESKLHVTYRWGFLVLGLIGIALFYGDSTITPAISVLSAVEGFKVVTPSLASFIIPVTLVILAFLFAIQKYGTGIIGQLFGPIMLLWFGVIAIGGGWQVWLHPSILIALSPATAVGFFISQPFVAFIAMGAVVLAITGAEALYADMGHFGRPPIARAWFFIVFPALLLCYMGEGALLLHDPSATSNPLVLLYPAAFRVPVVILATVATVIASQSVISGAFSLTRQAVQLNFLPKLLIRHTSAQIGGQIYLPFVNAILFVLVMLLIILFGSSANLSNAYGIAVSGTLAIDTILFLVLMHSVWRKPTRTVFVVGLFFIPIDLLFVTSSTSKIVHGGWFPIFVGIVLFVLINTWIKGQAIVLKKRQALEGSLQDFVTNVHNQQPPVLRIPGTAVYIGHHTDLTPMALHATLEDLHELHEIVVIVSVTVTSASHVPESERAIVDNLGYDDGISHVSLSFGFHDTINIPETLNAIRHLDSELGSTLDNASYFVSLSRIVPGKGHALARWRKYLYCLMDRNALSASDYYELPVERTVEMRSLIKL